MRKQFFGIITGTNGVGKTEMIITTIKEYLKRGKPVCVFNASGEKKYKQRLNLRDYKDIKLKGESIYNKSFEFNAFKHLDADQSVFEIYELYIKDIFKNFKNGLIVVDDAKMCFEGNGVHNPTKNLFVLRRQNNNDIIFTFHSLNDIPPYMTTYPSMYILKKSVSESYSAKNKVSKNIIEAQEILNEKIETLLKKDPDARYLKSIIYV